LESCTGGLVYSQDLQTCDWPRNVACDRGQEGNENLIESDALNVHIDYKKNPSESQSSREPRLQNHNSAVNVIEDPAEDRVDIRAPEEFVQRTNIEAEILGNIEAELLENIEPELLDRLSPQPSILSTITHGLSSIHSSDNSKHANKHDDDAVGKVVGKATFDVKTQFSGQSQSFGDRSEKDSLPSSSGSSSFQSDLSDIERRLLQQYPGESKHLDDSQDHVVSDNIFYYTEWDDPIYDQFQDYDYEEDKIEEIVASEAPVKKEEIAKEVNNDGEIWIDLHKYPQRLPRKSTGKVPQPGSSAKRCNKQHCHLPDCHCGGSDIPGNISSVKTPQLVILTFDDSLNDLNKKLYESIFHPIRRNPNGCPISATFYVSHEWTDYSHVQNVYSDGHEIASHSISHSFGEQFSVKKWTREMAGQREILAAYGGVSIDDIRGMRAPFLAIGGNNMYSMMYDANFTYDSSMPIYENKPPSYPYTLDYKIFHDCMIPPCPTKSYPGLWELPLVMWNDLKDGRCSMADACSNPADAEGVYLMIMQNFQRHYNTNRAPFGLYYHPAWFTTPHHKEGFELFLDTITEMEDVWLVTSWQAIQWMRNPTPLDKIQDFEPFKCDYKNRPPRCDKPRVCNLWHKSGVRYMRTCQRCPDIYPWTGRTGVANSLVDRL